MPATTACSSHPISKTINVVAQGVVLCSSSADRIMVLPIATLPTATSPPQKDCFPQAWKTTLQPAYDSKAKLILLWNLNREKRIDSTSGNQQAEKILEEVQRCHTAESDANPERQEERHQNCQTWSGSCCCTFTINTYYLGALRASLYILLVILFFFS